MEDTPLVSGDDVEIATDHLDIPLDDVDVSSILVDASSDAVAASSASFGAVAASSASIDSIDSPLASSEIRRSSRIAKKPISAVSSYADISSADEDAASSDVVDPEILANRPATGQVDGSAADVDAASSDVEDTSNSETRPATERKKYKIKHMVTPAKLFKVSQLYKKAVYDNVDIPSKKRLSWQSCIMALTIQNPHYRIRSDITNIVEIGATSFNGKRKTNP